MISDLLRHRNHDQTIFTFGEIARIVGRNPDANLVSTISYFVRRKKLLRLAKGIYSLDENYNKFELANKLRSPSYISLYSILQESGIVFQVYPTIFSISNRSETIEIHRQVYRYRKIKDDILLNPLGLGEKQGVFKATPERAILDKIYLDGGEYFDNLNGIDWQTAKSLNSRAYHSKQITKFIDQYA